MTGLDLISASMRVLGLLATGEVPTANESTDALNAINRMIDLWANEDLLIYSRSPDVLTLVPGKQSYTMGTGGDFNTARPVKIENAYIRTTSGSNTTDLAIDIVNQDEWASLVVKNVQSALPTKMFTEGTYPLETVLLWPIPSDASRQLVLWSQKPLTTIASLTTVLSLPPGYEKFLVYNSAIEIGPEFGREPSALIIEQATLSRAAIKRTNSKTHYMSTDAALMSKRPVFNWRTGE